MLFDRLDDEDQSPGHHLVEREALVDTVVGEPVLREVIGANPLAAIARPHERLAFCRTLVVLDLPSVFIDSRLQHTKCLGQILVLALFVLALHDDAGFHVREPDGRGGLVDMLPARTACAEQILAVFIGRERHFHILRLRQHRHGGGRGVDPPFRLGVGHPLHAVAAALVLQLPVDRGPREPQHQFLEATQLRRAGVEHLDIPALFGAVAAIHLVEVADEERRLVAASASPQFHDAAGPVGVLVIGTEFEQFVPLLLAPLPQAGQFRLGQLLQVLIVAGSHLDMLGNLALKRHELAILERQTRERAMLAGHCRQPRLIGEHHRINKGAFEFLEPGKLGFELIAHGCGAPPSCT